MSWAAEEFETLDLGDARLNRRAVLLAERLAQKPGASIPNACQNGSETVAADGSPKPLSVLAAMLDMSRSGARGAVLEGDCDDSQPWGSPLAGRCRRQP